MVISKIGHSPQIVVPNFGFPKNGHVFFDLSTGHSLHVFGFFTPGMNIPFTLTLLSAVLCFLRYIHNVSAFKCH